MSLIQKIRDKSALLIFILIVVSLVAFILQDAFIGKTGNLFSNDLTKIGSVDNIPISKQDFDAMYDRATQSYKQQQIPVSEEMRYRLLENTFNLLSNANVFKLEEESIGLKIAQKEFDEIFFGNNVHPYIKQQFTDPKTGAYNEENVKNYLLQIKKLKNDNPDKINFLKSFVKPILDGEMNEKYVALFTKAVYIPTFMQQKIADQNNQYSKIEITQIPYSSLNDSAFKVSHEDILTYVKRTQPNLLIKEASKKIAMVNFDIIPSKNDSLSTFRKMETIKTKLASASDLKKTIILNGANKDYVNNYLHLKDFTQIEQKIISSLQAKQITGPIINKEGIQLYTLINKREIPDSVTCRHILIGINGNVKRSDSLAKKIADSMPNYIKSGVSFENLVNKYSDDEGSKSTKGVYTFAYNNYANLVKEFADMIFFGKTGDKKVIKTTYGYHYLEIQKQQKQQTAYQIGLISKSVDASKTSIDSVNEMALKFISKVNNSEQFNAEANHLKLDIKKATIKTDDYNTSFEFIRPIVRWAFENKKNDVSNIISIQDKMYIATIQDELKVGDVDIEKIAYKIQNEIINQKKSQQLLNSNPLNNFKTTQEVASKNNTTFNIIDSIKFEKSLVTHYGIEPKLVAGALNAKHQNKLFAIPGNSGLYYFTIQNIYTANPPTNIDNQKIVSQYQEQINNNLPEILKKQHKIKDLRNNFY